MIYQDYYNKYHSIKMEKKSVNGKEVLDYSKYHQECQAVTNEFKDALAKEYCSQWPKERTDKIFEKAWADGHSNGYCEVEGNYSELVDFVIDIISPIEK